MMTCVAARSPERRVLDSLRGVPVVRAVPTANQQAAIDSLGALVAEAEALPAGMLQAFRTIPRHRFIDRVFVGEPGSQTAKLGLPVGPDCDDPETLSAVYVDHAITIQLVDGRASSSTTQPSLMAGMMLAARLSPGDRVLEIGTATGWNAALMARVVGPAGQVVSVECDSDLADAARTRLAREGYGDAVRVVAADGIDGYAAGQPYDAILVTAASPDLPPAWLDQLAVGGCLVLPLELPHRAAPLLVLQRDPDGWRGRLQSWTWFVPLRSDRVAPHPPLLEPQCWDESLRGEPVAQFSFPASDRWPAASLGLFLHLAAPGRVAGLRLSGERSHASDVLALCCTDPPGVAFAEGYQLWVYGGPALADEAERLLHEWQDLGQPGLSDWWVTVTDSDDPAPYRLERPLVTLRFELPDG